MAIYQDRLIVEIKKECKKGQSVENFINNWIRSGENFSSLFQFLISKGVETNKNSVWKTFRSMLTLPYSYENQFLYKWNSVAKAKGFVNAKQMITSWKKQKYTQAQIAEELGLFPPNVAVIVNAILNDAKTFKPPWDHKHLKIRNRDGFSQQNAIKNWNEKLEKVGYENLQKAIEGMKNEGLNYTEMAKKLDISVRAFRHRRKRIRRPEDNKMLLIKRRNLK